MTSTVESGGMKELVFGGSLPCISGKGVGVNLEEWVATLQIEFWTNCNLLNSKSVSDKNNSPICCSPKHLLKELMF